MAVAVRDRVERLVRNVRSGGIAGESLWAMALEVATLGSMMVTFVLLGRSLGAEGYGSYVAVYAIAGPLVTLAGPGVTLTLLQRVVRDREPLGATARSCVSLTLVLGSALMVVGVALAHWIVDDLATVAKVAILLTEFILTPLLQIGATTVQAASSFVGTAQIRIVVAVTKVAIVVTLSVLGSLTIVNLSIVSLVSTTVLAGLVLRGVGKRYGFRFTPGAIRRRHVSTNMAYSVGIFGASLNNEGDKTVLAANGFTRDTGLYGAATRIINMGLIPVSSLVAASHRRFLEHEEGVKGQHVRRAARFTRPAACYALGLCLIVIAGAQFLPILLGDDFEDSVRMVRWLAPVMVIRSLSIFPLNALMGLGHVYLRSTVIIVNALAALGLYIVLIPRFQWRGAIAGTLVSETIEALLIWSTLLWCQRREDGRIEATARAYDHQGVVTVDEPKSDPG